ncbi:MAG TPA: hypothetical protein VJW94_05675 [Candidatus Acidoferrum sp.]|nr:hypothetical protein [Candidatus Acidoferrum sp.]
MSTSPPITILATPKPFKGHIGIIQRNAITSWTKLEPRPEIILFGTEEGAAEFARELGLVHIAEVARNRHGTPLLGDIFAKAERHASHDLLAYVNADILLPAEFTAGAEKVRRTFAKFLAVGRRTNLEVREPLEFGEGWEEKLKERMRREGQLESHTGIDFFVFPRGTYEEVPPLAIGRVWFDQWCIKYARKKRLPVVDLTRFASIAHQLHDYNHVAGGRELGTYGGVEAEENMGYYGERPHRYTILSATHVMTEDGSIRRAFWRREAAAVRGFLWEVFVHRTLGVRKRLGLSGGT